MAGDTEIANIEHHIEQGLAKLRDVVEIHWPEIAEFLASLRSNPLVTSFRAVIPGGELSDDAMAILNGLVPLLGALGARGVTPAPSAPPAPMVPGQREPEGGQL